MSNYKKYFENHFKIVVGLVIIFGVFLGLSIFTFDYAEGLSYFSTDPKACTNCHIMQPQFDSWLKSSHRNAANCVDCHLPHTFIAKYIAKADNGYRHSKGFTFQDFKEPMVLSKSNKETLQNNCVQCHGGIVHELLQPAGRDTENLQCVHCHLDVGHGEQVRMGRIYDELMRDNFNSGRNNQQ